MKRFHLFLIVASAMFAYILLRGWNLSFTMDEATTYNFVVGIYENKLHSNNHLLNTLLMKVSLALFGSKEWALRLPNMLSFLLYAYAAWRLIEKSKGWLGFVLGMSCMFCIPFGLEFFSLARGYGLSLAFATLAFALFINTIQNAEGKSERGFFLATLLASLAVLANFNQLNFALILYGLIAFQLWREFRVKRTLSRYSLLTGLLIIMSIIVSSASLLVLQGEGDLNFGAPSYYAAFMRSIRLFVYLNDLPIYAMYMVLAGLAIVMGVALYIFFVLKRRDVEFTTTLVLIVGISAGWVIEHEVFAANLPQGRMNLIYMPLVGYLIFLIAEYLIYESDLFKGFGSVATLICAVGFATNFALAANLDHTKRWRDDAMTKDAILKVQSICSNWEEPASIERYWLFRHSTNYYIHSRGLNINWNLSKGIVGQADFLFIHSREWDAEMPKLKDHYRLIKEYEHYPLMLFQHKRTIDKE